MTIYNKLIFFVFSVFFTTTCNIKYYYQLMNFYKGSLFSHSLKVLNELSISCSNKNIIYKVCGNCLITKESFLSCSCGLA